MALPPSLAQVPSLVLLNLATCSMTGTLPSGWSALSGLTELQVQGNSLQGPLPASWSALSSLVRLNLATNQLTGTVPASWAGGLAGLTRLAVNANSGLCGPLPDRFNASAGGTVSSHARIQQTA